MMNRRMIVFSVCLSVISAVAGGAVGVALTGYLVSKRLSDIDARMQAEFELVPVMARTRHPDPARPFPAPHRRPARGPARLAGAFSGFKAGLERQAGRAPERSLALEKIEPHL